MLRVGLWAACVGLMWSATASAIPVYYTYGYFGAGRSYAAGDDPTFRFTMEYDLDRQPTYLNTFSGNLVTPPDFDLHDDPGLPWYGYYQIDYFHATLVGTSEPGDIDLSAPNENASFRQIGGEPAPVPVGYEDSVLWQSGSYYIQLVRFPGVVGAPIGSNFGFIADLNLGPAMQTGCTDGCGVNLHLLNVSATNSVPEPATFGLLLIGAGIAAGMKRRRTST